MSESAAVLPVTSIDVHENSSEALLLERVSTLEPNNADIIFKELKQRLKSEGELRALLVDNTGFELKVNETLERIRQSDFVPEWPIIVNEKSYTMHKSGQFELPDECVDYLRDQVKAREPEDYRDIMNFILAQCPLYITDVLQSSETLEFAIDEYKQEPWHDEYRPHSIVYRSENRSKGWWWNRWFGLGKGGRTEVERDTPIYPGETATCQDDWDDDLTEFSDYIGDDLAKQYHADSERIIGMLLNMPAQQRAKMMEDREYLTKKAAQCNELLQN